jgi:hypothetical protein
LAAEILATIGELPNGVLVAPRLLSNLSDAPMLGEAGILWQLTIQPEKGFPVKTGGSVPAFAYIVLISVFLFGTWRILVAIWTFSEARRGREPVVRAPQFQAVVWAGCVLGSVAAFWMGHGLVGVVVLVAGITLPVTKRTRPPKGIEDWPETNPAATADTTSTL